MVFPWEMYQLSRWYLVVTTVGLQSPVHHFSFTLTLLIIFKHVVIWHLLNFLPMLSIAIKLVYMQDGQKQIVKIVQWIRMNSILGEFLVLLIFQPSGYLGYNSLFYWVHPVRWRGSVILKLVPGADCLCCCCSASLLILHQAANISQHSLIFTIFITIQSQLKVDIIKDKSQTNEITSFKTLAA